jgi:hypothetical protein
MTVVLREVALGSVSDIAALKSEINSEPLVGAYCESIRLWPDFAEDGTVDQLRLVFDQAPDDNELDTVISASPVTSPHLPASLDVLENDWTELLSFAIPIGRGVGYTLHLRGSVGDATTVKTISLDLDGSCEWPSGGIVQADTPFARGPNQRVSMYATVSGSVVTLHVSSSITGTLSFSNDSFFDLKEFTP